jgi:putative peptidoglycan lipid II flippase
MAKKGIKQSQNEGEALMTPGISEELQAAEATPGESAIFASETAQIAQKPARTDVARLWPGEEVALVPADTADHALLPTGENAGAPVASEGRSLVRSAALVSLGNLGSSLIGMVRQIVVTWLGAAIAGPFNAALTPANNFFQLLINGSVSGALVPTFNDYASPEKRQEMRRVVFTVLNLILLLALFASIAYTLIAPWFVNVLVPGYSQQADKILTLRYSQIIFFSLVALGPFAVLLSALFALKEFGWPAFATAAYHAGIILGAIAITLFGSLPFGKIALPVGVLLGALGEIALLLPAMRRQHFTYLFVLDLKHPALRRIIKLYLPIMLSFAFTTALVFLDVSLWTRAPGYGPANTVAQTTATALLQFPVGLVAMALSFAVLPTLTEHARTGDDERFKATLLLGLRMGLLLMVPAMVGMWVLRLPIVYLLFAHHNNDLSHAGLTALALQNYVYQLPFVAVDQLLIAAFYARKNTITPVIVGIVCIGVYLVVALPFFQTIGIPALALANTLQNSMHAVILLFLLRRAMGSLHVRTALPALLKICVSAVLMGLVAWGAMIVLGHIALFSLDRLPGQLLTVIIAGGLASVVYFGVVLLFKVEEINLVKMALLAKLGRR